MKKVKFGAHFQEEIDENEEKSGEESRGSNLGTIDEGVIGAERRLQGLFLEIGDFSSIA